MSNNSRTRFVPITDAKSGKTRASEPVSVHGQRANTSEVPNMAAAPDAGTLLEHASPTASTVEPNGVVSRDEAQFHPAVIPEVSFDALSLPDAETVDSSPAGPGRKTAATGKTKAEIETLEQFIAHAYSRAGRRVNLRPKTAKLIAQNLHLDDDAKERLRVVAATDSLLTIPRQLLLVTLEVTGLSPEVRGALNAFVSTVMCEHSMFTDERVQAAVRNLPEAEPVERILALVAAYEPIDANGRDRLKASELQILRRNAAYLLVTWFASTRALSSKEVTRLLFQSLWSPAASQLADDSARLRALTEVEHIAGTGLACYRFKQQTDEARHAQDHAQREAASIRDQHNEVTAQLEIVSAERRALTAKLEALQESSTAELAALRAQQDATRLHLSHELEQLRGRLVRRLEDSVEMLDVGLTALRNKTPRTEVMAERAEHVIDALRAELSNMNKE